jgi:hypothetical protein
MYCSSFENITEVIVEKVKLLDIKDVLKQIYCAVLYRLNVG